MLAAAAFAFLRLFVCVIGRWVKFWRVIAAGVSFLSCTVLALLGRCGCVNRFCVVCCGFSWVSLALAVPLLVVCWHYTTTINGDMTAIKSACDAHYALDPSKTTISALTSPHLPLAACVCNVYPCHRTQH